MDTDLFDRALNLHFSVSYFLRNSSVLVLCVCVFVSVYVCVRCVFVCVCVCVHTHKHTHKGSILAHVCACIHECVCVCARARMYVCVYVCLRVVCICVCVYIYAKKKNLRRRAWYCRKSAACSSVTSVTLQRVLRDSSRASSHSLYRYVYIEGPST
jgi:hypothetical protein